MKKIITVLVLGLLMITPAFAVETAPGFIGPPVLAVPCTDLTVNLHYASRDSNTNGQVTLLQNYLIASHNATFTASTGYFGPLTRQAAIRFQQDQSITPAVGFVGPITRARIHDISCLITPPPAGSLSIVSFSPASGDVGSRVTIYGTRFTTTGNSINFGGRVLTNIRSSNGGTSLTFTVPSEIGPPCAFSNPRCEIAVQQVVPGPYIVSVSNSNGTSNSATFNVTSPNSNAPVISSVSAPTHLNVNQTGTWTVHATDPQNGQLTYSVNWGSTPCPTLTDQYCADPVASGSSPLFLQSATFTHSYSHVGTYIVYFTVRNSAGQESQTSATVTVTN